jgi:hypothetical protein
MEKIISIHDTIHNLSKRYPEIIQMLFELGFNEIVKPGMLSTVGRFVTLEQGASMRKIDLAVVQQTLIEKGFTFKESE